jgi:uncharacterized membrane protein YeaQ/YmgE (transglycosylase-associated protein family)
MSGFSIDLSKGEQMQIIWMIIIGLVAGAVAKLVMPGRDPGGIIVTILLGIAGSIVAGFLGRALGWYAEGQGAGLIASVVGAILLLVIYRMVAGQREQPHAG